MRQDILAALRRRTPRRVPWTIHHELLPRGSLERRLRGQGLAIVEKSVRPYREGSRRVSVEERQGWEGDHRLILRTWHTPLGDLAGRLREGPDGSLWTERYPLGSAADFRLLEYIAEDTEYRPNDEAVAAAQRALGEDGLVLCRLMRSPLQRLLTEWLGDRRLLLRPGGRPAAIWTACSPAWRPRTSRPCASPPAPRPRRSGAPRT